MCLLTFLPPGVMPDVTALLNGSVVNDDGHGFALITDDTLIVGRGMDAHALVDQFHQLRCDHPGGPALFHSRFSTHGVTSTDNCHPFPVGGDPRTVLAHNGVLPASVQPAIGDPRSDTRIAAEEFLTTTFGPLRTRRARLRVERWMTPHNKMVILTTDRRFKQQAYILNEASGIWDNGIWYSNAGYRPTRQPRWPRHTDPWNWFDPDHFHRGDAAWTFDRCGLCRAILDPTEPECPYCGWCTDCGEEPDACLCYRPLGLDAPPQAAHRSGTPNTK